MKHTNAVENNSPEMARAKALIRRFDNLMSSAPDDLPRKAGGTGVQAWLNQAAALALEAACLAQALDPLGLPEEEDAWEDDLWDEAW
jgi:hypothetical protein